MKVCISKASHWLGNSEVREYDNLQDCIDTLLSTEDFGHFRPSVIVEKADDITKNSYGKDCKYEITIYDTWVE